MDTYLFGYSDEIYLRVLNILASLPYIHAQGQSILFYDSMIDLGKGTVCEGDSNAGGEVKKH